jgi:hypothetical protein
MAQWVNGVMMLESPRQPGLTDLEIPYLCHPQDLASASWIDAT